MNTAIMINSPRTYRTYIFPGSGRLRVLWFWSCSLCVVTPTLPGNNYDVTDVFCVFRTIRWDALFNTVGVGDVRVDVRVDVDLDVEARAQDMFRYGTERYAPMPVPVP